VRRFEEWIEQYKERSDWRYPSFLEALRLLGEAGGRTIVETGTIRMADDWGAGYSTLIFGKYCSLTGAELHTIDIDPRALAICKAVTKEFAGRIRYVEGDSVGVLEDFGGTIDLLYLDSLDFPIVKGIPTARESEEARRSQEHNLNEMKAAHGKLSPKAVVLIDDNLLPLGGKTKMSKAFLLGEGWKQLIDGQQALFVRPA